MNQDYLNALEKSKIAAKEEYKFVKENLESLQYLVAGIKQQLKSIVSRGESLLGKKDASLSKLREISNNLNQVLDSEAVKYHQSVAHRAKKLEKFTVMLFGRTMAGKSTIREAITGGDGSTIGQGAQRTTRDIKEYEWEHLRVVDTPGFGAWGGEEDTAIAHSVVEESDLILFLLSSDSVQLSTAQEIKVLNAKNKPIIFVLNVKKDLVANFKRRERFLKKPESLFSREKIGGHIQRLETLARDELGINARRLKIVPLHAQSAYLATQENDPTTASQLYSASQLPALFDLLSTEISVNGPVRRIQSLLDSAYNHLDSLGQHLLENKRQLESFARVFNEKREGFGRWFESYDKELEETIGRKVDAVFLPISSQVSAFVDENIEHSDFDQRWKHRCKQANIELGLETIMAEIQEDVKSRIEQFNREVKQDVEWSRVFNAKYQGSYNPWDYKRLTGWASALSGGGATLAAALAVAGSNFWNPVGWVLGGAAVVFGVLNFFSDSREQKLKTRKNKIANDMREDLDKQKTIAKRKIKQWFNKNLKSQVANELLRDSERLVNKLSQLSRALEQGAQQVEILLCSVNRRLIQKSAEAISGQTPPDIKKIVRIPGYGCFFTVNGYFRNTELLRQVGMALSEHVTVVYDGKLESMISHALGLRHMPCATVEVIDSQAIIHVPNSEIGKVIGRDGWRVKLVTALLDLRIRVVALN